MVAELEVEYGATQLSLGPDLRMLGWTLGILIPSLAPVVGWWGAGKRRQLVDDGLAENVGQRVRRDHHGSLGHFLAHGIMLELDLRESGWHAFSAGIEESEDGPIVVDQFCGSAAGLPEILKLSINSIGAGAVVRCPPMSDGNPV